MGTAQPIERLTIKGFKSIECLDSMELRPLNVLIGANGAGKSNFVSYFRMLGEMSQARLQVWTRNQGSADRILSFGIKNTTKIESFIKFGRNGYKFAIEPTIDGGFSFINESIYFTGLDEDDDGNWIQLGHGHEESKLGQPIHLSEEHRINPSLSALVKYLGNPTGNWKVFHFHDTSDTAGVKRLGALHDQEYLRSDASNLAAFLYKIAHQNPVIYQQIRKTIRLAIPFFDDFVFRPQALPSGEEQINLLWRQNDSDYPFWPSQLSDGSIRFICLATALLQPDPPSTIIIDEPELGLHPYAITLLGSLLRSASKRMQVIVSTQSVPLVNEFEVDDLIIVERENDATVFARHDSKQFEQWLEDYSVGELWEKNILGGRPGK
jgi:predicted ATPase